MTTVAQIERILSEHRYSYASEAELQAGLAEVLASHGIAFEREVELGAEDRIDFLLPDGLGLEVKVKGSLAQVTRQLHRYAQQEAISGLLLVSTRMQHRAIPRDLNGKQVGYLHLGGAF